MEGDGNCVVCKCLRQPTTSSSLVHWGASHGYVRKKPWDGTEHLYLCRTCLINGCPWARRTIASNCTLPQGCFGFCGISVIKWLLRGPSLGILLMYSLKLILLCSVGGCSFENLTRRPLMDGSPRSKGGMGSSWSKRENALRAWIKSCFSGVVCRSKTFHYRFSSLLSSLTC